MGGANTHYVGNLGRSYLFMNFHTCLFFVALGTVLAYERCWIVRDQFGYVSFDRFFQQRKSTDYNSYTKAHFDTKGIFNGFNSDNPSVLGRFASLMSKGCKTKLGSAIVPLPKIVVVVPVDNLLKLMDVSGNLDLKDVNKAYSRIINFIMTEFKRCVASFKENLLAKSIRSEYPSFCRTVKVMATMPYYIRATFPPLRHSAVIIQSETPLYT